MNDFGYAALLIVPLLGICFLFLAGATPENIAGVVVFQWLLLPLASIKLSEGIPVLDKTTVVAVMLLVGVLLSRPELFLSARPKWIDVPMLIWCLTPLASSLDNGLGIYDGVSAVVRQIIVWGIPYALGRVLSPDTRFLFALAKALLIGAVIYAPLCLVESRLAPQLHEWVYGIPGRSNWEQVDFFGPLRWKATVFLESQLELTPLMGIATLFGLWLWRRGKVQRVGGMALGWLVPVAATAAVLGKSFGGLSLTLAGAGVLLLTQRFRTMLFLSVFCCVTPLYVASRTLGWWSGQDVVDFLKEDVSSVRARSFQFRLKNEDMLLAKSFQRPIWGWGSWGRSHTTDQNGKDVTIPDGMWAIAIGDHGIVGLSAFLLAWLLPVWALAMRRDRRLLWEDPRGCVVLVAAVAVVMHSIDCIANAMSNPIYPLLAGSVASIAMRPVGALFPRRQDHLAKFTNESRPAVVV
jgi:hypothetical protein